MWRSDIRPPPPQGKPVPASAVKGCSAQAASVPVRTRMATRQQSSSYFDEDDEDMTDLQPTFSGPVVKSVKECV